MNNLSSKLIVIGILVAVLILVLILFKNGTIPGLPTDEEQEQIPENSVFAQLTLNIDMPIEDELQTFKENFKNDIVSLLNGVTADKVLIINIVEGSVVINFYIAPAEDGTSLVTTEEISDALSAGVTLPSVGATLTSESITSGPYIVSEDGNAIVTDPCAGVVCAASGQCKVAGTCSNGVCTAETNAVDNTPCDDGNPQTTNDICTSGRCSGTETTGPCAGVICAASDQCKVAGTCRNWGLTPGVCSAETNAVDNTPCDDGNPQTTNDICISGSCSGTDPELDPLATDPCADVVCSASGPCKVAGACVPFCSAEGQCIGVCSEETIAADNTPCDDGHPQTINDICTSGSCSGDWQYREPGDPQVIDPDHYRFLSTFLPELYPPPGTETGPIDEATYVFTIDPAPPPPRTPLQQEADEVQYQIALRLHQSLACDHRYPHRTYPTEYQECQDAIPCPEILGEICDN